MVGVETSDEAMQVRQIICRDGRHPRVQLFAKAFDEHLRKRLDMACSCFEMWTAGENLLEPDLLVVGEVVGVTQHPRRDPPHLRHFRCGRWCCPYSAKRTKVIPDGAVAAAISQCSKFFVEREAEVCPSLKRSCGYSANSSSKVGWPARGAPNNSSTLLA